MFGQIARSLEVAMIELAQSNVHVRQQMAPHEHGDIARRVGKEVGRILGGSLAAVFRVPEQEGGDDRLSSVQVYKAPKCSRLLNLA